MIGKITGHYIGVENDGNIIIDVNGVGFSISVSEFTKEKITNNDLKISLFTYMNVRENEISLFGFLSKTEKEMFMRLISVSGVGPKVALNILSGLPLNDLVVAIITENIKYLSTIKGIGKKTAERIILELKEILAKDNMLDSDNILFEQNSVKSDAIIALKSLGIDHNDAYKAVQNVFDPKYDLEKLIFQALKSLNK
ncbi:MAG: Holliday junction branch migration protein RuvA [Christensenellales bacterium]|jgi:Holliday junction DNA helicase RuvA|nr:Holliday junction branch migration protein RuvA [Clostridiales bacterium]